MLIARSKSFFSTSFEVLDGDRPVAWIKTASWRERATAEVIENGYRKYYSLKRDGWLTGAFLLLDVESVVCSAVKPSAFSNRFELDWQGHHYVLLRPSIWSIRFELVKDGVTVGSLVPKGFFRRRIEIDLPEDLPAQFSVFVFWLALVIWQRDQQSAAAS